MALNHGTPVLHLYEIPAAKALFGAALLQYTLYSVIYIIEGFKLQEFEGHSKPKQTHKSKTPPNPQNNPGIDQEQQEQEQNQKPTDLKDIALEDDSNNEVSNDATPHVSTNSKPIDNSISDDEEEEDTSFEMPFLMMIPKHYQKSTIWFMLALGLCAVRAPNDLTISVAYIQVLFRLVQMIGAILQKRRVSQIGYILASICIVILFFAAMVHGISNEVLPNY